MPFHHTSDENCFLCEDKLRTADPDMVAWFLEMKKSFPSMHISWAFRDEINQNKAVAEGKSKRPWPTSAHNAMKDGVPASKALDLFSLDNDGKACFPPRFYFLIAAKSKQDGFDIEWAGEWKTFKEQCHYQIKKPLKLNG